MGALEQTKAELKDKVIETTGSVIGVNMLSESMYEKLDLLNSIDTQKRLSKLEKCHTDLKIVLVSLVEVLKEIEEGVQEIRTKLA